MATYGRSQVPEEFYDVTSSQLLVQPEPQYLYAQLFKGALQLSLDPGASMGLQVAGRPIDGVNAPYIPTERDRLLIANPMFSELLAVKADFNAAYGSTLRINRPVYANTTYTEAGRRVASGATISTTPISISSQQTNLTLYRYAGPYDQANTRVAPFGIEAFDSNMGVHNASRIHAVHLQRDFDRFIEGVQVALLDSAATAVYPASFSTPADNDATASNGFEFTLKQVWDVEAQMDTANLPTFGDGFRALVLTPKQLQDLKNDTGYKIAAQFFPQYSVLFPSYVASIGKFHVFKFTTNTQSGTVTIGKPGVANSSGVGIQYGHAIAPGALMGGMGRKPRVMPASQDNYGETALVIWLADLAFGLANNSFVYSMRSA